MIFNTYSHTETDEEASYAAEEASRRSGVDPAVIQAFLETNPLYEIEFDVEFANGECKIVACRPTGDNPPWELSA